MKLLSNDLTYAESPRWHDGSLYISDVHAYQVVRVSATGEIETIVEVPNRPAGMGFLPSGEMLLATAFDRVVSKALDGRLVPVAELADLTTGFLNDMVVTPAGDAYVGATGFNLMAGDAPRPGQLVHVPREGEPRVVSDEVMFPNGVAVDGSTLVLAETAADRVSRFTILADGSLGPRETWAELPASPDGLCLDAAGGAWVALLRAGRFVHLDRDGAIDGSIDADGALAVACVTVGDARQQLALCSAYTTMDDLARGESRAAVHLLDLAVPGSGTP